MARRPLLLVVTVGLAACASNGVEGNDLGETREVAQQAIAAVKAGQAKLIAVTGPLEDATGRVRGRGQVVSDPDGAGLIVRVAVRDFAPGSYAVHVHSVGRCEAPDFQSAGAHWNPTGAAHGRENPAGPHLGDLPNLSVAADRAGSLEFVIAGATLTSGTVPLLDTDGAAIVVHERPDDYRTDPSGSSGARVACGVLQQ